MLMKNVYYQEPPAPFEIRQHGKNATILFPTAVETVEGEEETQYFAKRVYVLETGYTPNLEERINNNFDLWLARAKVPEEVPTTLDDVVEAINALTDIVMGGM
jgi:hypothetical protein